MAAAAAMVLLGGVHSPRVFANQDDVTLIRGSSIRYRCGGGEQLQATYYSLRDRSLAFVRLRLPDGRLLTLPAVDNDQKGMTIAQSSGTLPGQHI